MTRALLPQRRVGDDPGGATGLTRAARRGVTFEWRRFMQWQTPTAIDFRFGFEITMYVAAR
jgi:coenzyme PQQ precursor peptide PqqA